ncbi:unnamed protein product [Adineta steineri]|uniref:GPR158/179 extracellular domain-containing protein n=1 Tax=Adineta steineri TaxID=433720 RepID=A0A815AD75_9BILA|nr:unnamed protein product [Adineta steineri]CAF1542574.1 unnamed protein product [Adineta steineri]
MLNKTCSQFEWISYDKIDEVMDRINSVNSANCFQKQPSELVLPEEAVYQKPSIEMLKKDIIMRNRTQLLHVRNIAHRNALLYSYLFQRLFDFEEPGLTYILLHNAADITGGRGMINGSGIFFDQDKYYPHWYKNYFNKTLPLFGPYAWRADDFYDAFNWKHEWTNHTIQEEDIGAGRNHHYTSRYNRANEWYSKWLPDQTRNDQGREVRPYSFIIPPPYLAVNNDDDETEKNEWKIIDEKRNDTDDEDYNDDDTTKKRKPVHSVQLLLAERMYKLRDEPQNFEFYGPPHPEDPQGPTLWTRPYFDCGRSNKWVISAVSPIVDIYPRHTEFRHLQAMKNLAVAVAEIDFIMMDINQCAETNAQSNDPQSKHANLFAGTDKCKPTTRCEPLIGFGFRRGGYQCLCQPGYRYPPYQDGPFKGYIIEKATQEEYVNNFDCLKVELYQQIPQNFYQANIELFAMRARRSIDNNNDNISNETVYTDYNKDSIPSLIESVPKINLIATLSSSTSSLFKSSVDQFASFSSKLITGFNNTTQPEDHIKKTRSKRFAYEYPTRIGSIMQLYDHLNHDPNLCELMTEDDLTMPGDVLNDVDIQFESQARLALTLSHFLSSFYQIVNPAEDFPLRKAELELTDEQLIGEVLAAAGGDYKVVGVGIYFDRGKFPNYRLPFFGPYAYRSENDISRKYTVVDWAGLPDGYENEIWFRTMKARWGTNADRSELTEFWLKLFIRSDYIGNALVHHESGFPLYSYAPELKHGQWFPPTFQCSRNYTLPRQWIVTYAVPFFGLDTLGINLEFKGVVRVDAYLNYLDINQCSMPHYVPNAFKGSDRCDYQSTVCEPIFGRGFRLGKYKCRCRPGYEYPFIDQNDFFNGDAMDIQWDLLMSNNSHISRFDQLKCRIAMANSIKSLNWIISVLTVFCTMVLNQ